MLLKVFQAVLVVTVRRAYAVLQENQAKTEYQEQMVYQVLMVYRETMSNQFLLNRSVARK